MGKTYSLPDPVAQGLNKAPTFWHVLLKSEKKEPLKINPAALLYFLFGD